MREIINKKSETARFITSILAGVLSAGKLPKILSTIQLPPMATVPLFSVNVIIENLVD